MPSGDLFLEIFLFVRFRFADRVDGWYWDRFDALPDRLRSLFLSIITYFSLSLLKVKLVPFSEFNASDWFLSVFVMFWNSGLVKSFFEVLGVSGALSSISFVNSLKIFNRLAIRYSWVSPSLVFKQRNVLIYDFLSNFCSTISYPAARATFSQPSGNMNSVSKTVKKKNKG